MKKSRIFMGVLYMIITLVGFSKTAAGQTGYTPELRKSQDAIVKALTEMGLPKGDDRLLVLTNAGYGQIDFQSTEAFLDIAHVVTGRSLGTRSIIVVHTPVTESLWCALYRKDTGKVVFFKWMEAGFAQQVLADQKEIITPEGWRRAASGLIGNRLFSVISICYSWSERPPWPLLQAAAFHDHFCPGVNSGYLSAEYLKTKLPLGPGDKYVFVTAPGKCAADALQVMYNTTAGKESGYTMYTPQRILDLYFKDGVGPATIAMRVNKKADSCEGIVLGFDWTKAYADTGIKAEEHSPPGGPDNPMFWISRVIMSWKMAQMSLEKQFGYVVEVKRFSGKTGLAEEIAAGDPYAPIWKR